MIAAVAVLGLLVLDRYMLTPFASRWRDVSQEHQRLSGELKQAALLFKMRDHSGKRWAEMCAESLKSDQASAESQVLHALRGWSEKNSMELSSVTPDYGSDEEGLSPISYKLSCRGSMRGAAGLLWDMETSDLPVQIKSMRISSTRESGSNISLHVEFSTIYVSPTDETALADGGRPLVER